MLNKTADNPNAFAELALRAVHLLYPRQGAPLHEMALIHGPAEGASGVYTVRVLRRVEEGRFARLAEFAETFNSVDEALLAAGPTEKDLPGCRVELLRRGAGEDIGRFRKRVKARTGGTLVIHEMASAANG